MRKIILFFLFGTIFLLTAGNISKTNAAIDTINNKCYVCPDKSKSDAPANQRVFWRVVPELSKYGCFYLNPGVQCDPNLTGTCPWADGSPVYPNPVPDDTGVCKNGRQCAVSDPLTGCTNGDTQDVCKKALENAGSCTSNTTGNANCRPDNKCTSNYCIINLGGTEYQETLNYYVQTGRTGVCKHEDTAPNVPPDATDVCITCPSGSHYQNGICLTNSSDHPKQVPPDKKIQCESPEYCVQGKGCQAEHTNPGDKFDGVNTPTPVCKSGHCDTALGNLPTTPGGFINRLIAILMSLIGGIAVILIIISGYRLMISQGNPEKVQGAKDQLTAAIVGLLFVIFSLVILQVIGYDILRLPGFGA